MGYFIFNPMVMLFSYLMTANHTVPDTINTVGIMAVIPRSFSISMVPWSLSFALFNGIIGFYYGTFKAEKLAWPVNWFKLASGAVSLFLETHQQRNALLTEPRVLYKLKARKMVPCLVVQTMPTTQVFCNMLW